MATILEVSDQVDLLADAYGRNFRDDSRHYDAYFAALSDLDGGYLRRGVVWLLRDKLQFMPTPAEVRAHSIAAKDYDRQKIAEQENRRLVCKRCQDTGCLWTLNRRWFAEHRDQFDDAFFTPGWLRKAFLWCRQDREDIFVYVICGCACRRSEMWLNQLNRWKDSRNDRNIKASRPAMMNVYDEESDCLMNRSGDATKTAEDDARDLLLQSAGTDLRVWQGNWNP